MQTEGEEERAIEGGREIGRLSPGGTKTVISRRDGKQVESIQCKPIVQFHQVVSLAFNSSLEQLFFLPWSDWMDPTRKFTYSVCPTKIYCLLRADGLETGGPW